MNLTSAVSGGAHVPVSSGQGNGWPPSHAPLLEGAPTKTPSGDGSASYFRFPTPRQAQLPPAPSPAEPRQPHPPASAEHLRRRGKCETTLAPKLEDPGRVVRGGLRPQRGGCGGALTSPRLRLDGSQA